MTLESQAILVVTLILKLKLCEAMDNVEELEKTLPKETMSILVYVAGYVTRKDAELDYAKLLHHTSFTTYCMVDTLTHFTGVG